MVKHRKSRVHSPSCESPNQLTFEGFEHPFDASLFVDLRKRVGVEVLNSLNERIVELKTKMGSVPGVSGSDSKGDSDNNEDSKNRGQVIFDATACPQDIAYPADLDLLSDAREVSERLIDQLYTPAYHTRKPRTYRRIARKVYLSTAQKKNKSRNVIRKAVGKQLNYLRRNITNIHLLLDFYTGFPLKGKDLKYFICNNKTG